MGRPVPGCGFLRPALLLHVFGPKQWQDHPLAAHLCGHSPDPHACAHGFGSMDHLQEGIWKGVKLVGHTGKEGLLGGSSNPSAIELNETYSCMFTDSHLNPDRSL